MEEIDFRELQFLEVITNENELVAVQCTPGCRLRTVDCTVYSTVLATVD